MWDNIITYGPGCIEQEFGDYEHHNPTNLNYSIRHSKNIPDWEKYDNYDNRFGRGLLYKSIIFEVLKKKYYQGYIRTYNLEDRSWRQLNLSNKILKRVIDLCENEDDAIFARVPKGRVFPIYDPEYGIIQPFEESDKWKKLQDNIALLIKNEVSSKMKMNFSQKTIYYDSLAYDLLDDINKAYYYTEALMAPYRLGVDILGSSFMNIGRRINNFNGISENALVKVQLFLNGIDFWPSPKNLYDIGELKCKPEFNDLKYCFHDWKERCFTSNKKIQNNIISDLQLASKSIKRLRSIRKTSQVVLYTSAVLGNIPFSSPFFAGISILIQNMENKQIQKLGSMGIKVI